MDELLDGFVPGLPEELRDADPRLAPKASRSTPSRRCACCSTAGCSCGTATVYRPTGEIASLEVPETLHALIASRLDGLPAEERRLLQDAAVLGKTFTRQGLAAVGGVTEAELEPLLASLVAQGDPRRPGRPASPEHGQYGFLQDLVRHVAYETLSKKERRARHLAAAAYLVDAFAKRGRDRRGPRLALPRRVHGTSRRGGRSRGQGEGPRRARPSRRPRRVARSLGRALRYFAQAAELTDDALERAALLDRAGWLAVYVPDWPEAERLLGESIALYTVAGETRAAARVSGRLAIVEGWQGRIDAAIPRAEAAFAALEEYEPGEELAGLAGYSRRRLLLQRRE